MVTAEVVWTVALVTIGCTGLWLAPKHWWGWAITTTSEALWFSYALTIGAWPLALMAVVWFAVNLRNMLTTRRRETHGGPARAYDAYNVDRELAIRIVREAWYGTPHDDKLYDREPAHVVAALEESGYLFLLGNLPDLTVKIEADTSKLEAAVAEAETWLASKSE